MSAQVSIGDHFKRLFDFSGREDRASFWPYAAVAFLIVMVAGMTIFVPIMHHAMGEMQQYALQHPNDVTVSSGPGHYSIAVQGRPHPNTFPAGWMAGYLLVTFGLSLLLYAAAVVRRLHDRDMTGYWALMPLPFILYSSIQMPRMFGSFAAGPQPDLNLFFSIFISNMLYMIALVVLIVLLAGASSPGATRFDGM